MLAASERAAARRDSAPAIPRRRRPRPRARRHTTTCDGGGSWLLRSIEALIHGLDEVIRRARTGRRAVALRIAPRRRAGLDLCQRHPRLLRVADSIADDRDHVAIFRNVGLVADPAVPRDDE